MLGFFKVLILILCLTFIICERVYSDDIINKKGYLGVLSTSHNLENDKIIFKYKKNPILLNKINLRTLSKSEIK